jgi:hypothetical protein
MPPMTLAVVWHYWIGVAIFIPAILLLLWTIFGYFIKVSRTRYPK